ncbi:hypothetical protein [Sedimenticola selenatireducens]|uniref:Uncharacterized protein n=1 Tax=Sedimenticola selenatireducens TaxID=191960 RepID=A0A2N6CW01_9GAMM|nr:hypothetical protein [Sedimenticola selenatireducens]PLX61419.1 MAG: hypothetical protein C0630_10840 [Sedimenticola selenatireducens]
MFRNGFARRGRWFVLLSLLAFSLALGIGAFLWHMMQTSSLVAIQTRVELMKPLFTTIRLLLIGLLALAWPAVIRSLHRRGRIDAGGAGRLLSLRWRIVTWLLIIELLLGQNLLGRFLVALQGAAA